MYQQSMFLAKIRKNLKIVIFTAVKISVYFMGVLSICREMYVQGCHGQGKKSGK